MTSEAKILDGKAISAALKASVKEEVDKIKQTHPDFQPGLAIVQVGGREDSSVYVGMKIKTGGDLGFDARHVKLPSSSTEANILQAIDDLNKDVTVHGIIVQLPLDCENTVDAAACTNQVLPRKDVDGLHELNAGRLARGELESCFQPCTPRGCMSLIRETGVPIEGAHAVVVGRSKLLGSPMANLLTSANATVTICHSRTKNLESFIRQADIVVAACGQLEMIKGDWIKAGAVVIDCGINVVADATRKSGRRLVGDVEYAEARKLAGWITPVPGGVGPMTVATLMQNTLDAARRVVCGEEQRPCKQVKDKQVKDTE